MRRIDQPKVRFVDAAFSGNGGDIRARGPTRIGIISPRFDASMALTRVAASHGCAITGEIGVPADTALSRRAWPVIALPQVVAMTVFASEIAVVTTAG